MTEQGRYKVQFNVFNLKKELEKQRGQELSWAEIAREAGLHPNTLANIYGNRTRRIDMDSVEALMAYFERQGMPVGIGDIFSVERTNAH